MRTNRSSLLLSLEVCLLPLLFSCRDLMMMIWYGERAGEREREMFSMQIVMYVATKLAVLLGKLCGCRLNTTCSLSAEK